MALVAFGAAAALFVLTTVRVVGSVMDDHGADIGAGLLGVACLVLVLGGCVLTSAAKRVS
ncbi:hypothetical protein [Curtobacterium sp. Leaf261]|uniref:hypothetical protein n=1 Tax=Curtobacterium sp. Leaf261 TaxID=1736311 RepID=UPI0012E0CB61|nr:hypothetical protein [Curtobacterium sp. Leaf261]